MKLTKISVFKVNLPFDHGTYTLSGGRTWTALDSTIIRLETNEGLVGWGETCPFGPNYLEAFADGARAGIAELAPSLLGTDPSRPALVYDIMNNNFMGHPYVKHGIDMACWDLLGRKAAVPLYTLLGGGLNERVPAAGGIPFEGGPDQDEKIRQLRTNGCAQFSAKASGAPEKDIADLRLLGAKMQPGESLKLDSNGGWRVDEAIRVMRASEDLDVYFEQPCASYEECRTVHRACGRPILFDECALDLKVIVRGWHEGVCHAVNLKIGRVGGISRALEMKNFCAALGIPVHVQCTGGSNITQAAIVHLAQATPAPRLLWIWDIGDLTSFKTVRNPIQQIDGYLQAHDEPGLGVEPLPSVLGDPVTVYKA